jgi:hypothetical protein
MGFEDNRISAIAFGNDFSSRKDSPFWDGDNIYELQ